MVNRLRISLFSILLLALLASLTAGCSGGQKAAAEHSFPMAPVQHMPAEVKQSPVTVQQSYQFAAANPDVLDQIPCYCGCGAMGHDSNYDCYVTDVNADGSIVYDSHALGCSICVDITLDTMRLLDQGKTVAEIKAYIDQTYAQYGPSNIP
jgi:hypothetical protein